MRWVSRVRSTHPTTLGKLCRLCRPLYSGKVLALYGLAVFPRTTVMFRPILGVPDAALPGL